MTESAAVPKVYAAICAVQGALAKTGISKDRQNKQGEGFKFRGIDDVYGALAPMLHQFNLVIIPRFTKRTETPRETRSGAIMYHVAVEASFLLASAEDGSTVEASMFGEAFDSGDKATNKAMSAAYKYAAFQLFCIPVEGESPDADETTPPQTVARGTANAAAKTTTSATPPARKDGAPVSASQAAGPANTSVDSAKALAEHVKAMTDATTKPKRFAALMAAQKAFPDANSAERKIIQDKFSKLNAEAKDAAPDARPNTTPAPASAAIGGRDGNPNYSDEAPPPMDDDIPF